MEDEPTPTIPQYAMAFVAWVGMSLIFLILVAAFLTYVCALRITEYRASSKSRTATNPQVSDGSPRNRNSGENTAQRSPIPSQALKRPWLH